MKTNNKAFQAHVRAHILDALYDYTGPNDDESRARRIRDKFESEYDRPDNRRRTPNHQARVAEWLSGLPLNIAYANCDILALSESWHGESHSEKQAERIVSNWFNLLAFNLILIWREYGIEPR